MNKFYSEKREEGKGYPMIQNCVIVLDWKDINNKPHQEIFCSMQFAIEFYGGTDGRSYVHTWNHPEEGVRAFLSHCPLHDVMTSTFTTSEFMKLASRYIIIPTGVTNHE